MKIKLIWKIVFVALLYSSIAYGQTVIRHVISVGGRPVVSNSVKINCTIGQTHIGFVKSPGVYNGVGYWYEASYLMSHPNPLTVVLLPNLSAEIGEHVSIPLTLQESKYFDFSKTRSFEAKVKYNTTVLQPVTALPVCLGDECVITIKDSTNDSSGVLANIDFIVRLGSVEKTALVIESFKWLEKDTVVVLKQDGEFEVLGICREGDTIRTVKKTVAAGLYSSNPNPAGSETLINYSISERGNTKIILVNNLGREVAVIFNGVAEPGRYSLLADLTDVSSGLYYLNLITPTERFSDKLLIKK